MSIFEEYGAFKNTEKLKCNTPLSLKIQGPHSENCPFLRENGKKNMLIQYSHM